MISRPLTLRMLTTAVVSSMIFASPARSATFSEQEVEQSNVIAVAEPLGETGYNLIIIEQIPGQQQCWRESGEKPTTVEPLLLNFDFTKSCRRSTDSNGYSIRIDGQDYGLDYLLRIVERNGELQLVGTPRSDRRQQEVIVGRTYGVSDGFLKIVLNPGWQFTKRAYQGKTLGHVYLAGSSSAINSADSSGTESEAVSNRSPSSLDFAFASPESPSPASGIDSAQASSAQSASDGIIISVPPPETSVPAASSANDDATRSLFPPPSDSPEGSISSNRLPPPPIPQSIEAPATLSATASNEPLTSEAEGVALAVPPPSSSQPDNPASTRRSLSDVLVVAPQNPGSSAGSERLPVPQQPIPSADPLPAQVATGAQNYKVMVEAGDASQATQVRSLYPDAFSAVYEGRSLLQVGVFSSQDNADKALQSLESLGLTGVLVPF